MLLWPLNIWGLNLLPVIPLSLMALAAILVLIALAAIIPTISCAVVGRAMISVTELGLTHLVAPMVCGLLTT